MDFDLEPKHLELRRKVREFCEREVMPRAQENDAKEVFPWDLMPGLRKLGLLGIPFPKKYGGQELDAVSLCVILEELGAADAALALTVESHNGLCTNHIFLHGSEEQRQKYVPRLASGEVLGAWALTEPGAGSDAASITTKAVFDGKFWLLNGSKTFTTQGSVAGTYVVFAQTPEAPGARRGLSAFVMEKGTPGLNVGKIEHKMGIRSSDTAQLHLHDVRLTPDHLIGQQGRGFRDAMKVLDGGRVAISGISVGIARASLEEGLKWVKARQAEYGITPENSGLTFAQKTLAQLAAEIDGARLLMYRAACLMDAGRPFSQEASIAKLISGDLAMRAPTEILDVIGPHGASLDCPVQRFFRDAKLYQIGEGSSQIQQLVISRHLLSETADAEAAKTTDYSATLNLPKTDFPMKGDLPKREPEVLARWADLYQRLRKYQKGRAKTFVLHDGPPYANGHIHIGHALNKVLKDMTVKSRSLMGYQTPYVPGWDCHGLPIETALLKELKMSKRGVKDVRVFRDQAEAFAERFIGLQREEFRRLGALGDWDKPYKTMAKEYEARVLRAFRLLLKDGHIYRGLKPIYWCITDETALAEAEIEYKDKTSPSVYVAFPITNHDGALKGASVVIWTTTPWTLPANKAVALHPALEYVLIETVPATADSPRFLIVAEKRLEAFLKDTGITLQRKVAAFTGEQLAPMIRYAPPYGKEPCPGVTAEYVTAEDGTGIVHTAPGHGADDFATGRAHALEIFNPVDHAGRFTDAVPEFLRGKQIFAEGNPAIVEDLAKRGLLLAKRDIVHSYPHCWRCKNPIVFRTTEQWFLGITPELRTKLLAAIDEVAWLPAEGKNRIAGMVEGRPDWCLSRQRVWGTPIPILFCVACREPLTDDGVLKAIEEKVSRDGDGFWFSDAGVNVTRALWDFLPEAARCAKCSGTEFHRENDILDVWMDSGASWLAVLDPEGQVPCDLYLEGSDQHRGWFQSSLVLSVGLNGKAPYKKVLTHGFVLDEHGRAMHKSAGNVVAPQTVIDKLGADVLRLWVALCDYSDDVRLSDKLLEVPADAYRKFRNTLRYLLGNTFDFAPEQAIPFAKLPELERFVLHRLAEFQKGMLADYEAFQFRSAARRLGDFCAFELSSFYLDMLKDRLYTFAANDPARRAAQTVMAECLRRLLHLASPILSFTAEEGWGQVPPGWGWGESVFLSELPALDPRWTDEPLAQRWAVLRKARGVVSEAIEKSRAKKEVGSSLQAKLLVHESLLPGIDGVNLEELFIVSGVEVKRGAHLPQQPDMLETRLVAVSPADGAKCPRCWRYQTDIGSDAARPDVCGRCARHLK